MATSSQLQTAIYDASSLDFHDITSGNNGFSAGPGYDLVTGIGSPVANRLLPDLAGTAIDYTVPPTGGPHQLVLRKNGANVQLLDNGVLIKSLPAATLSAVNIVDSGATNDVLTVDYSFGGSFAAHVNFNHVLPAAGDDTVAVALPKGAGGFDFAPTAANAGTITAAGPVNINFAGVENVIIQGHGDGDNLTVTTPGAALVTVTPGALEDEGQATLRTPQSAGGAALLGFSFTNIGGTGSLTIADADETPGDVLTINGTSASTEFKVSSGGNIDLTTFGYDTRSLVEVHTPGVATLCLDSSADGDVFDIQGNINFSGGIYLDASGPTSGNTLDLTGAQLGGTVDLGNSSLPSFTTIDGYGATVRLSGIAVVNLALGGMPLTVNGTSQSDTITYTPTGAAAGSFALAGLGTAFNFTGCTGTATGFTINGGTKGLGNDGVADQVIVQGTSAPNLFEIDQGNRTVRVLAYDSPTQALQPVTLGDDIQTLTAVGPQGENTFQVIPAEGIPAYPGDTADVDNLLIYVQGGGPALSNVLCVGSSFAPTGTMGALPATETVVIDSSSLAPDSGMVCVSNYGVPFPDINYVNIGTVTQGTAVP
jgi:hypothetical protein